MKTTAIVYLFNLLLILSPSCSKEDLKNPVTKEPKMKMLTSFDAASLQLPENIAVDHLGNIYVSMSPLREIWKLSADGTFREVVANFPLEPGVFGVSGLAFDPKGNLYVAIASTISDMNGIWKISSGGEKERIVGTSGIFLPNDLTILPNGTVYITDSAMGAVWCYKGGGQAEVCIQHEFLEGNGKFGLPAPIGANGIVHIPGGKAGATGTIIVANSEKGQLVTIPVLPDGSAGEPKILVADSAALFGIDGIISDSKGNIYAAVNFAHKVLRISRDGGEITELASGAPLDFPTDLAFGTGRNRHTLYITNFSVIHFLSDPPMPENANPGIVALGVEP